MYDSDAEREKKPTTTCPRNSDARRLSYGTPAYVRTPRALLYFWRHRATATPDGHGIPTALFAPQPAAAIGVRTWTNSDVGDDRPVGCNASPNHCSPCFRSVGAELACRFWDLCWRRGVVVSVVRLTNEVTLRRARLVLACVTVFGRVYHHVYVTGQLGQLSLVSLRGR